ncbi:MAG: signal peptidase II [Candidatus Omnitrophica bacterium CG12_big_fil_rev_8_21_14_0_65_50_5]|nr:MAG: signal peptidase II [Candidatus Omnitrophica bacterium CG12_big_fil_rev_8_21_14_0_65_50_5]
MLSKFSRSQSDILVTSTVSLAVILLDRLSKMLISDLLHDGESLPVIPNVFHLTLVHNTGIAFGLFKDQGIVFLVIPVAAIVLLGINIFYYIYNDEPLDRLYLIGFSLILGGAVGNLIDRVQLGHVVDFLDFRIWPVFNIADSAITIGAAVIAYKCFRLSAK